MENYIAIDEISKKIINSAKLLKNVKVNALITGKDGSGKKSLSKFIIPDSKIYNVKNLQQDIIDNAINLQNKSIIVDKIHELTNIEILIDWIQKYSIRIIAISNKPIYNKEIKDIFSVDFEIPDLEYRPKDTKALTEKFSQEISNTLNMEKIDSSKLIINVNNNTHSLRKYIYFSYLFETIGEKEILMFLEKYLTTNLIGESSYKELLYLFEVPLLKASINKYKSQVQIAKHLGLNRITLRKKLDTHKELL